VPVLAGLAGAVLVLLVVWGYRDIRHARGQLAAARETLRQIADDPATLQTPRGREAARGRIDQVVGALVTSRRGVVRSPVLSLARVVPGLSTQRHGLLGVFDDGAEAARAGGDLLGRADALADRTALRDGLVPAEGIRALEADVRATAGRLRGLVRSRSGLWGPVRDARRSFDDVAVSTADRLDDGSDAMRAVLAFVGGGAGDRRHLVALQNNAEMRDQGMVLQYAVATFSGGRLGLERNGSVGDLQLEGPAPTPVPQGTHTVFGPLGPTQLWQSVNATADFALSGRAMSDMFRQATGTTVDGVIGIDVPGLAALLDVVGPLQVPGIPEPLTAQTAGRILLHDLYLGLPPVADVSGRRERLGEVTRALVDRLTHGSYDVVRLGRALGDSARGGHLRLWSGVAEEEEVFERSGIGGSPATRAPQSTFHLAVQNRTATKLDFFVHPRVRQHVEVNRDGDAVVRTTVLVDNQAPPGQAPSYQLGPDENTQNPGDYLAWLLLWAPPQARQVGGVPESGLLLSQHVMPVAAGQARELTFTTGLPDAVRDGAFDLRLVPQPRLLPVDLQVRITARGWDIEGPPSWAGPWDQVLTFRWGLSR
jgi:Protein of unknown function (DUF4012)